MRIIILGAGQVGGTLAKNLAREDNDITLVDLKEDLLRSLQHRLDIQTVPGSAAHPQVLIDAGIEQADMLIAVTDSDEVNMIACQIAYSLFRTPTKIARIRSSQYLDYPQLFCNDHIPVDYCISPERLVTQHISNLIDYPGASQVLDFAEGKVLLVTLKSHKKGLIPGKSLAKLQTLIANITAKALMVYRNDESISIDKNLLIEENDEVVFLVSSSQLQPLLVLLNHYTHPNKRLIIAGGGRIGKRIAQNLEHRYRTKIIEHNKQHAQRLASQLSKSTVLEGDIGDRELLLNENIEFTDVFCAVTNDDEANIMACLLAKKLGARHTMALVNRNAYVELIDDSNIDHAISPQFITIGSILAKLRRGDTVKVHQLWGGHAEALQIIVHGNESTSKVVGRTLADLKLPSSCTVGALLREQELLLPKPELMINAKDHIILIVTRKRDIKQVEHLFQVNLTFF